MVRNNGALYWIGWVLTMARRFMFLPKLGVNLVDGINQNLGASLGAERFQGR